MALPKGIEVKQPTVKPRGFLGTFMGKPKSGKTITAMKTLYGLNGYDVATFTPEVVAKMNEEGAPLLVVETMGEGVEMYAKSFPFRLIQLTEGYKLGLLADIIGHYASNPDEGVRMILVDSFSAFWTGKGGVLTTVNEMGGKYSAWQEISDKIEQPFFSRLKNVIEQNRLDVAFTVRTKNGITVSQEEDGKTTITKAPDKPISREGWAFDSDYILEFQREGDKIESTLTGRNYEHKSTFRSTFTANDNRALAQAVKHIQSVLNRTQ